MGERPGIYGDLRYDLAKLAQMIPYVGAPVGAVANWGLTQRLGRTAMNAYRLRALVTP